VRLPAVVEPPRILTDSGPLEIVIPEALPRADMWLAAERPTLYHVEIWCEKSTVNEVLEPLADQYGLNLQTAGGEMSTTRCRQLVERAAANGGRPVRIIYVSDFDPAGQSMPVATARKIEFFARRSGLALDIQLQPIVLTHDQCVAYRLPRTPIKEAETRAERFEERFGEGATELDALEALHPGALREILVAEIERFHNPDFREEWRLAWQRESRRVGRIRAEILGRHTEQDDFARRLAELEGLAYELETDIADRNEEIEAEMQAADVGEIDMPEPPDADEWDDPLLDSARDYVEQIDAYKDFQGKPTTRRAPSTVEGLERPKKPREETEDEKTYSRGSLVRRNASSREGFRRLPV
jgi:hypothetical protein